uniref:Histone domain-containing protein n=1 Tax=Steinernema glaseri TaxID=37863 RepID=A0A1I7YIR7_9BILA
MSSFANNISSLEIIALDESSESNHRMRPQRARPIPTPSRFDQSADSVIPIEVIDLSDDEEGSSGAHSGTHVPFHHRPKEFTRFSLARTPKREFAESPSPDPRSPSPPTATMATAPTPATSSMIALQPRSPSPPTATMATAPTTYSQLTPVRDPASRSSRKRGHDVALKGAIEGVARGVAAQEGIDSINLNRESIGVVTSMLEHFIKEMADEARHLARERRTLEVDDIRAVVRLLLPSELARTAEIAGLGSM